MTIFRQRTSAHGFSLIELLTVIAVIAVLAAILLPMVYRAQAWSEQSKCMSGLRQMQLANMQYATDHDGRFVPVFTKRNKPSKSGSDKLFWHNNRDFVTLLGCPEDKAASVPLDLRCPVEGVQQTGWGFNSTGLDEPENAGEKRDIAQHELLHPSESMAIIDALDFHVFRSKADAYYGVETKISNATAYRHNGKACLVYWDGHTGVLTREEVLGNDELWQQKE